MGRFPGLRMVTTTGGKKMGFEILVFGLVLFCVEGLECDNWSSQDGPAARLLLVNATKEGPNCNDNGCLTCGGDLGRVYRHQPLLVFQDENDINKENLGDLSCDEFKENDDITLPQGLSCWKPINRKLCVELTAQDTLKAPKCSTNAQKPDDRGCGPTKLRWLGSVSFFDNRYSKFKSDADLGPGDELPTVTWLDLPDAGTLENHRVGGRINGNDHTIWRRKGAPSGKEGRALAERVLWKVTRVTSNNVVIKTCDTKEPRAQLTLPPGKRVVVLNLPHPIFDKPSLGTTYSRDVLEHFRLYYNLFVPPTQGGICDVPMYKTDSGTKSELKPFLITDWLRFAESRPTAIETATETALCPPTKFP